MDLIQFWTICSTNGIILDAEHRERLTRYGKELLYWNRKINLISRKDEENVAVRHLMHSLTPLKYIDIPAKSNCIDIGSGGGLPGIPIAIALGNIKMTLIDSIAKKVKTTEMLAEHTALKNIKAITARVEDLADNADFAKKVDFVFARGVAQTVSLVEWSKPLLKKNGKIVLLKGGNLDKEKETAIEAFPDLFIKEIQIDFLGEPWFRDEEKKLLICEFER